MSLQACDTKLFSSPMNVLLLLCPQNSVALLQGCIELLKSN